MKNIIKLAAGRFIRNRPRPMETFVGGLIAWSVVAMALASSTGLIIAAVRLL